MRAAVVGLLCAWVALAGAAEPGAAQSRVAGLRPFDAGTPARLREELQGRPFVLAFWSVHCAPCREEMPQWKRLRDAHPGLTVILVSADEAAQHEEVSAFLAGHDLAGVRTYLFHDEFGERVRFAVDPKWRGELPRTYYYDAQHRVKARSGKVDEVLWERWLGEE